MNKINVKHPFFIYVVSFGLVITAGFMKILNFEIADLLINITFSVSLISLIYALVRLKKMRKNYTDMAK